MIATTYPLTIQTQIDRLFRIATQRPGCAQVSLGGLSVQQTRGGAAAIPWWLSGGISAGDVQGAWRAIGVANYAVSLINLNNPGTDNLIEGVAPTWDTTTGWTGNALNMYLIAPDLDQATGTLLVRFSGAIIQGVTCPMGWNITSGRRFAIYPSRATDEHSYRLGNVEVEVAGRVSGGVQALSNKGYLNGVPETNTASFTNQTSSPFILARNNNGTPDLYFDGSVQAAVQYNRKLTDGEIAAVSTAMAAL